MAARDCAQADTISGIFAPFRARLGLKVREARAQLVSLKQEYKTSLQAHAMEVERLVNVPIQSFQYNTEKGWCWIHSIALLFMVICKDICWQ